MSNRKRIKSCQKIIWQVQEEVKLFANEINALEDILCSSDKEYISKYYNMLLLDGLEENEAMIIMNEYFSSLHSIRDDEFREDKIVEIVSEIREGIDYLYARKKGMTLEEYYEKEFYDSKLRDNDSTYCDDEAQIMQAISNGNGDLYGY